MISQSSTNKVTLTDIAKESGVSVATVSLVLRNKPGVSTKTRQRVLDIAQTLGYLADSSLNKVQHKAVNHIGLIVKIRGDDTSLINPFYTPVLAGIEAVCRQQQINLFYAHMPVDEDNNPLEIPRLLTEQHADGLLFVGAVLNESFHSLLQRRSVPVVLVDAYTTDNTYDAVISDNEEGAYQATNYLIQNGHRHIVIAGSLPHSYPSIQMRREGYLRAIKQHGLPPYFVDGHHYPDEIGPKAYQFLQKHPEVTAVFACNDDVAITVMQAAQSLGKDVPNDISIIGFDNITLAQRVTPTLTTMRVDKMGMGRLASQLLLNRLEYPQSGKVQAVIHPSLIERQSVKTVNNQ